VFSATSCSGFITHKVILSWKNTRNSPDILAAQHIALLLAAEEQWVTATMGDRESQEEILDRMHSKRITSIFTSKEVKV